MQEEHIIFRIDELEKRVSKTSQKEISKINSNEKNIAENTEKIEEINQTLQQKSEKITEIEGEVDAINNSDFQTQIDDLETSHINQGRNLAAECKSIRNYATDIETELQRVRNVVVDLDEQNTQFDTDLSNINLQIDSLNSSMSANINRINQTDSEIDNIKQIANSLSDRIDKMDIVYGETFNSFDKVLIPCGRTGMGKNQIFSTIFFLCDTSAMCRIKIKTRLTTRTFTSNEFKPIFHFVLDDDIEIFSKEYTATNDLQEDTIEFTYDFFPTKPNHKIRLKVKNLAVEVKNHVQVLDTEIEILGRNIVFLNKDRDFKVYLSKDYYYLTKNGITTGYFKKVNVHEKFDITSGYTEFPVLVAQPTNSVTFPYNTYNYNFTYLPYIVYDDATEKFVCDQSDDRYGAASSYIASSFVVIASQVPVNHTNGMKYSASQSDLVSYSHPGNGEKNARNTAGVFHYATGDNAYQLSLSNSINSAGFVSKCTLNGQRIDKVFVFNTSVFAKDWETNPDRPYYYIATDECGNNTFFNARAATYSVDVGFGTQVNAFMQSDGSINVYLRVINNITKKVLKLNEATSQYEVVSEQDMGKGWEYIEGYYDDYFINEFGTWKYYQPTDLTTTE